MDVTAEVSSPLAGLVVIECDPGVADGYCGLLCSWFGATVLSWASQAAGGLADSPPEGWPEGLPGPQTIALNTGKQTTPLPSGQQMWRTLESADIVLASAALLAATGLSADGLRWRLPRAVIVRGSPYGDSGPYANYASLPGAQYALSGYAYTTGDPGREPLIGPPSIPGYMAGANAYIGALAALRRRERTGTGDLVEVSELESLAAAHQWTVARYQYNGRIMPRNNARYDSLHPVTYYPCADGTVAISPSTEDQLQRMLAAIERPELNEDPRFATNFARIQNADAFDEELEGWFRERTREEISELFQAYRVPTAPALDVLELLEHPQLKARSFWIQQQVRGRGVRTPGAPFRFRVPETPASGAATPSKPATAPDDVNHPLAGLRVLDLTRVWSGPLATRVLGDLGAEVIKVEHPLARGPAVLRVLDPIRRTFYPADGPGDQPWNTNSSFNKLNRNKLSLTLDLSHAAGREAFLDLVEISDVVIENYSPRVMANLGLGFEALCERNGRIVQISMPGYGLDGPLRDGVAYGSTLDAEAGIASLLGYEGGALQRLGVALPDPVAGMHAAAAVLTALAARDQAGSGVHIDLSQLESMAAFLGDEIAAAQVLGRPRERMGNRDERWAPHGVYRCEGDDEWVFIGISSEAQWDALAAEVPGLSEEARFSTPGGRKQNEGALDAAITAWTSGQSAGQVMGRLQARGVPAAGVWDAAQLCADPHLNARDFFVELDHPLIGKHRYAGQPIRFAEAQTTFESDAPLLGQHNVSILAGLLGYSVEQIAAMADAATIATRPPS